MPARTPLRAGFRFPARTSRARVAATVNSEMLAPDGLRSLCRAMPAYETIDLDVRDGVAHLTLNRPDAANGINLGLARDLMAATLAIAADPGARVVLLSGRGQDVLRRRRREGLRRARRPPQPPARDPRRRSTSAITKLVRGDAPVVAAVQGSAAGAGMGFVGASDLVVAAESAKFVMAYTGVGLTPDGSSSWFLPRLVGLRRALELTLTNRVLSAAEALDWGLITQVVPDDELADAAGALAAKLAAGPAPALAAAKRLLHTSLEETLETHLAREAEAISQPRRARPRASRAWPRSSRSASPTSTRLSLAVLLAHRGVERGAVVVELACAARRRARRGCAPRAARRCGPCPRRRWRRGCRRASARSTAASRGRRAAAAARARRSPAATSSTRSCPAGARRRRRRR